MRNEFEPVDPVPEHILTDAREETEDTLGVGRAAEFAELAACVEAGVARNRRVARIVFEVESLRSSIGMVFVILGTQWISPSHQFRTKIRRPRNDCRQANRTTRPDDR